VGGNGFSPTLARRRKELTGMPSLADGLEPAIALL